jgi:hypothetical protein
MTRVTFDELADSLTIVSGTLSFDRFSAYGIFRNEMFFAPAFLAHHRSLGVEQFLILDDGSDDGTREFLASQPDCVVLASSFSFGQRVLATGVGEGRPARAGTLLKTVIPRKYLSDRWALYLDADEFLFLPPQVPTVQAMAAYLEARGARCVVASLVDFYPANLRQWRSGNAPLTLHDLLADTGYFDAEPVIALTGESTQGARRVGDGASVRLFKQHGIADRHSLLDRLPRPLRQLFRIRYPGAAIKKQPLIHWGKDMELVGSHHTTAQAPADVMLTLAHFKFTSNLSRRAVEALEWKSYSRNSLKYDHYMQVLDKVAASGGSLLGPTSKHFAGINDLIEAGVMIVPPDLQAH